MTQGFYGTPMGNFYRNQMNNIAGGYNNYPTQFNPPQMGAQVPQNEYPCRPVTNKEEARAAMLVDNLKPNLFTDFANNKIYVKYIDNSGNARFSTFAYEPEQVAPSEPVQKVDVASVQADIEAKFKDEIETLKNQVNALSNEIVSLKEGAKNATEPVSKSSTTAKSSK